MRGDYVVSCLHEAWVTDRTNPYWASVPGDGYQGGLMAEEGQGKETYYKESDSSQESNYHVFLGGLEDIGARAVGFRSPNQHYSVGQWSICLKKESSSNDKWTTYPSLERRKTC
jgi:hypothetical protein